MAAAEVAENSVKMDMITKRPRTPNGQYTCLTETQLKNIKKSSVSSSIVNLKLLYQSQEKNFQSDIIMHNRIVDSSQHKVPGFTCL